MTESPNANDMLDDMDPLPAPEGSTAREMRERIAELEAALQLSKGALSVALEIAAKVFEEARSVECSGSPGEGQWEDMHQIDHALKQVSAALQGGK